MKKNIVIQCLEKLLKCKVTPDMGLMSDLKMNSMMMVSLGMILEEKTKISVVDFSENIDFVEDVKVQKLIDFVDSYKAK